MRINSESGPGTVPTHDIRQEPERLAPTFPGDGHPAWDALARSFAYRLAWSPPFDVAAAGTGADAQVDAALRTVLLAASGRPVDLTFRAPSGGRNTGELPSRRATPVGRVLLRPEAAAAAPSPGLPVLVTLRDLSPGREPDALRAPVKRLLARHAPLWMDLLRQWRTDRMNARVGETLAGAAPQRGPGADPPGSRPRPADRRTVLFCMHWLDYGGAETFALHAMAAAHAAGFAVVLACDRSDGPYLLSRARRWASAVYMLDACPALMPPADILGRVLDRHRPDILHIHHSAQAYAALPAIAARAARPYVVDTTHILEHRGGGFVADTITRDAFIDRHHVVSHRLGRLLAEHRVPAAKVRMGKLHDMSRAIRPAPDKWRKPAVWRVAFVGRFTQQKRPFLFVEVAARLQRRHGAAFAFAMMGSGELLPECREFARRRGLDGHLAYLPGDHDVADVLAPAHVVLMPSDNEGLALVAFEAVRADCLVVSCDVGAQAEIVLPELLVPRSPFACVRRMQQVLEDLQARRLDPERLLVKQRQMLDATLTEPTGLDACDYAALLPEDPPDGQASRE